MPRKLKEVYGWNGARSRSRSVAVGITEMTLYVSAPRPRELAPDSRRNYSFFKTSFGLLRGARLGRPL